MMNEKIIGSTESLCPVCLQRIPARRIAIADDVYLDKNCPEHGSFRTIIWRGNPSYESWSVSRPASRPSVCGTRIDKGCPFDCGLCPDHRQRTCCVLLEVTQRCNLNCNVCFASAAASGSDPEIAEIEGWFRMLMQSGGPYNIQLSGGEPTLRDDLPEIISLGRSSGFTFFQLNTNGIRLAEDPGYVKRLKNAGLGCVFLQFDGTTEMMYKRIRGRDLFATKEAAITNCSENGLGVVLVPTLVPGINVSDIGRIIDFAIERMPAIKGVHFQPVSYFGRYPKAPADADRITIPEVITEIERQTIGKMRIKDFRPPSAENAYCSFNGSFVLMENGDLKSWKKGGDGGCCLPAAEGARKAQLFVEKKWSSKSEATYISKSSANATFMKTDSLDDFLNRVENYSLCISGMAFQDAWNIDLERLRECFIHVFGQDNSIIPFCAYNLTGTGGNSLYRQAGRCL
jgi:uncharacterized radical SAM superfamily Fe-S cluster-containing enzyme